MAGGKRKVAILGTAPSTCHQAPFKDKEWEIFCTGGDTGKTRPRYTRWYEIHDPDVLLNTNNAEFQQWHTQHINFLKKQGDKVFVLKPTRHFPDAKIVPAQAMVNYYDTDFFTSAPAWMLAHLHFEETDGGKLRSLEHLHVRLFGIDMASDDERKEQWDGVKHFTNLLEIFGAKIEVPEGSTLIRTRAPYPFNEETELAVHMKERIKTINRQIAQASGIRDSADKQVKHLEGMLDEAERVLRVFT